MRRRVKKCYTLLRRSTERVQKKLEFVQEMAMDEFNLLVGPDQVEQDAIWLGEELDKIAGQVSVMKAALLSLKADMRVQMERDSAMYDHVSELDVVLMNGSKREKNAGAD